MIRMDKEWVSPTDEEQDALRKQIMKAMFPIIKPMATDEDRQASVKRILSAIQ